MVTSWTCKDFAVKINLDNYFTAPSQCIYYLPLVISTFNFQHYLFINNCASQHKSAFTIYIEINKLFFRQCRYFILISGNLCSIAGLAKILRLNLIKIIVLPLPLNIYFTLRWSAIHSTPVFRFYHPI